MDRTSWNDEFKGNADYVDVTDHVLDPELHSLRPGTALDLGCGSGRNTLRLAELGWTVVGVDWADHAIGLATQAANDRQLDATFIVADTTEWKPEREFDLVFSTYALPGGEGTLEELFEEQLGSADLIVLNKTDLLPTNAMGAVRDEVAPHLRPEVKVLQARHGGIEAGVLLGLAAAAEDDLDSRPSHHDDGEEHDHDDFTSFALELGEFADPAALLARLKDLVARHDIFRVKGFAAVAGKGMRRVVQGVGGRFQSYYDRDWALAEPRATRLVFIGHADLDRAGIAAALEA